MPLKNLTKPIMVLRMKVDERPQCQLIILCGQMSIQTVVNIICMNYDSMKYKHGCLSWRSLQIQLSPMLNNYYWHNNYINCTIA